MGNPLKSAKKHIKKAVGAITGRSESPVIVQEAPEPAAPAAAPAAEVPKEVDSAEESQAENANKRRKGKKGVTINRVSGGGSGLNI